MRILVIGLGQCGSRIADEFGRLYSLAKSKRGLEVVTGAFAVSTDTTDLVNLAHIKSDYKHRMLIGTEQVKGQGVGGVNELGAQIAQEHADDIMDEIRQAKRFFETDALFVVAAAAGGTGSGALPVITHRLKQRFPEKKVFAMVVLPYEHEEQQEEKTVYNTAVCLKSVSSVADAVFLFDNEVYAGDEPIVDDYARINRTIVDPFYNLLCAGSETRKKHIGSKLLDAGDIFQTLGGWTVMGSGHVDIPLLRMGRQDGTVTNRGIRAMDESIGEISRLCSPADAARALYLITAPAREINMDLIKELGDYLKNAAPDAVIRSGDYPAERGAMEVTVIVSQLSDIARVRDFYTRSSSSPGRKKGKTPPAPPTPSL